MNLLSERYQLGDPIYGDAGVAVHRGYDQKLNRPVTIELPRAGHPNDVVADMLRNKARRMALADLPHLAALYDQGEQDGRPYLVFEELIGAPLAEVAPLAPADVVTLITALGATLRAARQQQVDPPRLDPNSVRFGDGRPQMVDWGIAAATTGEVAALSALLALAATGSQTGTTSRHVPAPLLRVVQRAVGGEYASADDLQRDLQQSVTAADEPTVALPRGRPTLIVPDRAQEPVSLAASEERAQAPVSLPAPAVRGHARRPLLLAGLGLALVLLLGGGLWARGRMGGSGGAPPATTGEAAGPAVTTSAATGTPYIVATNGGQRLNVRARPDQNSNIVGKLVNGTEVRVVEGPVPAGGLQWVRVEGGGVSGWCVFGALRPS